MTAKVAGEVASLSDPALGRVLEFVSEVGLVVLIHNDMDVPFAKEGSAPAQDQPGEDSNEARR